MASESSSTGATSKEPTPGDLNFGFLIFKHMNEKPNIDWDAFAADAGFKTGSVASTRYGQIKKKFPANQATTPVTPKKSKAGEGPVSASKVTKSGGGRVGTKGRKSKAAAKDDEDVLQRDAALADAAEKNATSLVYE